MIIRIPCKACKTNKRTARNHGCDGKPADNPVWSEEHNGKTIHYYHCANRFIPKGVHLWYQLYEMCGKPRITDFPNMTSLYIQMCMYYEKELKEYTAIMDKRKKK